ncbi:MAG: hypothetical protein U0996_22575 [Planctomycetaceae bacterium]
MATYRYKATLPTGVLVYGVFDADSQSALEAYLQTRGLKLLEANELSVDANVMRTAEVPRLTQLRVGDRIREALLTGMPIHQAVRAIAEEPLEHPLLMLMPWAVGFSLYVSLILVVLRLLIPAVPNSLVALALGITVGLFVLARGMTWMLDRRPRKILLNIADQMERGDVRLEEYPQILPGELQAIQRSTLPSDVRAITIAELVPQVAGMRLVRHQIASRLLAPLLISGLLFSGLYVFGLIVLPNFRQIFEGFGIELPWMTAQLMNFGWLLQLMGVAGFFAFFGAVALVLLAIYLFVTRDSFQSHVQGIPFLGTAVRWAMQARIARVLSVLIRNHADVQRAIIIATASSGVSEVEQAGIKLSEALKNPDDKWNPGRTLAGLPLSLTIRLTDSRCTEETRQETAQVFSGVAAALEAACSGQGAFIGLFIEMFVISFSGMLLGLIVISLFMPLIKLLNDLSIITGWWL